MIDVTKGLRGGGWAWKNGFNPTFVYRIIVKTIFRGRGVGV